MSWWRLFFTRVAHKYLQPNNLIWSRTFPQVDAQRFFFPVHQTDPNFQAVLLLHRSHVLTAENIQKQTQSSFTTSLEVVITVTALLGSAEFFYRRYLHCKLHILISLKRPNRKNFEFHSHLAQILPDSLNISKLPYSSSERTRVANGNMRIGID